MPVGSVPVAPSSGQHEDLGGGKLHLWFSSQGLEFAAQAQIHAHTAQGDPGSG